MPKGGPGGSTRYNVPTTRGADIIDGTNLDGAVQSRGLIIDGGAGDDILKGGSGSDRITGGDGTDSITGDIYDLLGAGDGTIVWDGGKGTDTLDLSLIPYDEGLGTHVRLAVGPLTSSRIWTNVNNPDGTLWGFDSADAKYLNNFKGFENVVMGGGDDWVEFSSGSGNNRLDGGAGNDVLNGGDGSDVLLGGQGNDILMGGWGDDFLTGGSGSDMFTFLGRLSGEYTRDTITDFDVDGTDNEVDSLWLAATYRIEWDPDSAVLHGFLFDNGMLMGEITIQNLLYEDAGSLQIYYGIDMNTGGPLG